jgi:predicted metal-dependent hydrolase
VFSCAVQQFEFQFAPRPSHQLSSACLTVGSRLVPVQFVRHRRARRYILRIKGGTCARVTIPRGGSKAEALAFVKRQESWIERQILKYQEQIALDKSWRHETEILFRGQRVRLNLDPETGRISFAGQIVNTGERHLNDLRPWVEAHMKQVALQELSPRVFEMAERHCLTVRRVVVRNQRSRWGSCSSRGTISLNWRLIQTPELVRDYLIIHELMHLREMNHSPRFWRHVEAAFPRFAEAEKWLRENAKLLR